MSWFDSLDGVGGGSLGIGVNAWHDASLSSSASSVLVDVVPESQSSRSKHLVQSTTRPYRPIVEYMTPNTRGHSQHASTTSSTDHHMPQQDPLSDDTHDDDDDEDDNRHRFHRHAVSQHTHSHEYDQRTTQRAGYIASNANDPHVVSHNPHASTSGNISPTSAARRLRAAMNNTTASLRKELHANHLATAAANQLDLGNRLSLGQMLDGPDQLPPPLPLIQSDKKEFISRLPKTGFGPDAVPCCRSPTHIMWKAPPEPLINTITPESRQLLIAKLKQYDMERNDPNVPLSPLFIKYVAKGELSICSFNFIVFSSCFLLFASSLSVASSTIVPLRRYSASGGLQARYPHRRVMEHFDDASVRTVPCMRREERMACNHHRAIHPYIRMTWGSKRLIHHNHPLSPRPPPLQLLLSPLVVTPLATFLLLPPRRPLPVPAPS